jgi:hypothetical protein
MTRVTAYLTEDHARLHVLLDRAVAAEPFDTVAFEQFRGGLLRHIGIEEKVMLPAVRRRLGQPLDEARQLRIEHGALTSLLVPTPDAALVAEISGLLGRHDAREEGADGVYARCEAILDDESFELAERARQFPAVPTTRHFDGQGVHRTAASALASSERSASRRRS